MGTLTQYGLAWHLVARSYNTKKNLGPVSFSLIEMKEIREGKHLN